MDKIYMVRAYFSDFESSRWKIIGFFTDKNLANEILLKWQTFFEEKKYTIFNEPKNWKPTTEDLEYGDGSWKSSGEYMKRCDEYSDVFDFEEIEIEEHDLNVEILFTQSTYINSNLLSLMTQWDRNHKLKQIL